MLRNSCCLLGELYLHSSQRVLSNSCRLLGELYLHSSQHVLRNSCRLLGELYLHSSQRVLRNSCRLLGELYLHSIRSQSIAVDSGPFTTGPFTTGPFTTGEYTTCGLTICWSYTYKGKVTKNLYPHNTDGGQTPKAAGSQEPCSCWYTHLRIACSVLTGDKRMLIEASSFFQWALGTLMATAHYHAVTAKSTALMLLMYVDTTHQAKDGYCVACAGSEQANSTIFPIGATRRLRTMCLVT